MRTAVFSIVVLVGFSMIGCAVDDPVSDSIGEAVHRGPGTRLALADHATFPWERACIFGPYTDGSEIETTTGVAGAAGQAHDIHTRDDINLLLFIHDGRITRSVALSRNRGDFGPEVVGKCVSIDRAVFSVRNPPPGSWGNIGPS
jgi:hypothetical protein